MLDRYDQDLLLDYLEGELDADRRAQLDALLEQDPQLATLLGEMAKDRAALRSLPPAEAPGDLVHDVTQTLERRMLLDEPVDENGPIPLARGRGLSGEPPRSISWGRVVGLTGLAASVALAAGIVVITLDDPLERTADHLAAGPPDEAAEAREEAVSTDPIADEIEGSLEGIAARAPSDAIHDKPRPEGFAGATDNGAVTPGADAPDESLALRERTPDPRGTPPPLVTTPGPDASGAGAGDQPAAIATVGLTGAISAIQPRQQLVLLTESPEVSFEQLMAFCVANGIPIVQPDEQAAFSLNNRAEHTRVRAERSAPAEGDAAEEPVSDYALLINESQLDQLVFTLNNDVTLEPSRAGKGSLFSNQAALIEELPEDAFRHQSVELRGVPAQDAQAGLDDAEEAKTAKQAELAQQQAIQLRLPPDLGSDYANTRNAYNLKRQEQANYVQRGLTETPAADVVADSPTEPKANVVEASEAERTDPEPPAELERALAKKAEDTGLDEQAEPEAGEALKPDEPVDDEAAPTRIEKTQVAPQIDPTRGNWLSAHLPVADTTPLLLEWRNEQTASPTNLVPVTIQRAEPDRVNTLRLRQQVELANRRKDTAKPEEAEPAAEAEADAAEVETQPAEPTPPAEAEPTQPAE